MIKIMPVLSVEAEGDACAVLTDEGYSPCAWWSRLSETADFCSLFKKRLVRTERCAECLHAEQAAVKQAEDALQTMRLITQSMEAGVRALGKAKASLDESLEATLKEREE